MGLHSLLGWQATSKSWVCQSQTNKHVPRLRAVNHSKMTWFLWPRTEISKLSVKDEVVNVFNFTGHPGPRHTFHLCQCMEKAAIDKSELAWLHSSKTLWTLMLEFHIIFICHEILKIFFNHLKMLCTGSSSWCVQAEAGFDPCMGHSLLTPEVL